MKTKALISFTVTAKLICTFVFAYADRWFSHAASHLLIYVTCIFGPVKNLERVYVSFFFFFFSKETKCTMKFGIFLPPQAEDTKCPVLYWLSGMSSLHKHALAIHSNFFSSVKIDNFLLENFDIFSFCVQNIDCRLHFRTTLQTLAITAKLISAFVFDTRIVHVQFIFFLNPKFPVYSQLCDYTGQFLAHLSRRLIGELIVYPCSGVRPSVRRPSSSTISKIFFSETAGPIALILHIHHLQVGGKNNCVFCFDWIRTLVAMATYASHRLIMEKVIIACFCCLVGDI